MYDISSEVVTLLDERFDRESAPDVVIADILSKKNWKAGNNSLVLVHPADPVSVEPSGPAGKRQVASVRVDVRTKASRNQTYDEARTEFEEVNDEVERVLDVSRSDACSIDGIDDIQLIRQETWNDLSDGSRLFFRVVHDLEVVKLFEKYAVAS